MAVPNMLPALLKELVIPVNATTDSQTTVPKFQGEFVSITRAYLHVIALYIVAVLVFFLKSLKNLHVRSFPSLGPPSGSL